MVEIGTGGYPGNAHCNPEVLLNDEAALEAFKALFVKYEIEISALSCHGNPIHPNKTEAERYHREFVQTVLLAEKLGIETVIGFSGCPGGSSEDTMPNWVTCSWPNEFSQILEYQWNEVLIPYWKEVVKFAASHGIHKIALEMHPGFCVYNTDTLLRLREAVGPEIGTNFDPSHLIWQGMDPVASIRKLKEAIFHFHAKDTYVNPYNKAVNGVLDTSYYGDASDRSWLFRSVGYGMSVEKWREIMSVLRMVGYDYAVSIEHEDNLMSKTEGIETAVKTLKDVMIFDKSSGMWWT